MDFQASIEDIKKRLNGVSPSFCLAKWLQVTIHLQNGQTHSCHHPGTHAVPLEELEKNPSALHNTNEKKRLRKMMLDGKRPKECNYCWMIEDTPGDHVSDRFIKSMDGWSKPYVDRVAKAPWNANVRPTYVEVSFSSACNFKCAYCGPNISTKWMEEINKHGPYPTSTRFNNLEYLKQTNRMPIPPNEKNPYVEAFWKWWPSLYKTLKVFRITGGEPLLSPHTFGVLKHINENPNEKLELGINSNLGAPRPLIQKFADQLQPILENGKLKTFTLYTSIDTHGEQASYIRHGMDYDAFISNVEYMLERIKNLQIVIMCTYNALSVPRFRKLLDEVIRLRKQYFTDDRDRNPLILDISYLRDPSFMSVKILPPEFMKMQEENLRYMEELSDKKVGRAGFYEFEIAKMRRLTDWMRSPAEATPLFLDRSNFFAYFDEYDRRRKTNFCETFPELKDFYDFCGNLHLHYKSTQVRQDAHP